MPSILSQFTFKGRQEQAATSPTQVLAVTAGAGSGKTRSLVGRYLYLLEQGIPLRSLIAITFTEKAAREMRTRLRNEIERWVANGPPLAPPITSDGGGQGGAGVMDWPAILADFDSAHIGTIHSLCAEILRTHPAEAGIDPGFGVLEEGLAAVAQSESIDAALAWAATDPAATDLFAFLKENDLRKLLVDLLSRRLDLASWLDPGLATPTLPTWSTALAHWLNDQFNAPTWSDAIADLTRLQARRADDKLELARQQVLARWDDAQGQVAAHQWDSAFTALTALRKAISTTGGSKNNWDPADLEVARSAMRALGDHYDGQIKSLAGNCRWSLDEQVAALLPALRQLICQALETYQQRKDRQHVLDFDDLEGRAANLLVNHPGVRARWQNHIHAVLVDEFQDTNDRQRQIVYALTGFNSPFSPHFQGEEKTGTEDKRAVTNLFIVGDSKQSIYRFRGADVTVFRQVQADIAAANGSIINLDLTFRAHKPLLDLLNHLLAPLLGESDDPLRPYQVPFAPLHADRPTAKVAHAPYLEFHVGLGDNADEGRATAASALADRLRNLRAVEGFDWGDMALLFRSSSAFGVYEDALERAGIPFITVAGRGFYNRPEIRDLLNILTAIADPTDEVALVGLLRSPAIGFADADLYRLCLPTSPISQKPAGRKGIWSSLQASPVPQHCRAVAILTDLHAQAGRAPVAEVLKRFLDLTGYLAILSAAPGGSRMRRNVEKLLADAHRSRLVDLGEFLEYVQTLRDVGLREGEAPVDASGAVQLMSIHKSKGLEFPLVVIADAAHELRSPAAGALLDADLGLLPGLKDDSDVQRAAHPVAWRLAYLNEAAKNKAEDRRLLYVAATRAREKLLVSGHASVSKTNQLSLSGWLVDLGKVLGVDKMTLDEETLNTSGWSATFPSQDGFISWIVYPPAPPTSHPPPEVDRSSKMDAVPGELLAPLSPPPPENLDEGTLARESDPPQRVWRVVPQVNRPSGPAWVVGKLVHEALRRWQFPGSGDLRFEEFIRPYTLEAGLTDEGEIRATIQETRRLLERFRRHPLYAEIEAAERFHELPFVLANDRGVIDLLYRAGEKADKQHPWVILDFKTDEARSTAEAQAIISQKGYDKQVQRYIEAVTISLGCRPQARLVFLQVGREIGIFEI